MEEPHGLDWATDCPNRNSLTSIFLQTAASCARLALAAACGRFRSGRIYTVRPSRPGPLFNSAMAFARDRSRALRRGLWRLPASGPTPQPPQTMLARLPVFPRALVPTAVG